ncbi:hypothetical protein RIF29_22485 [Crotalaria pallida]|uniref:Uncharacterized protein n=1 Tax=Crotalaria pallida TaxID=3830 RepID=A0AAN9F743_CROPI
MGAQIWRWLLKRRTLGTSLITVLFLLSLLPSLCSIQSHVEISFSGWIPLFQIRMQRMYLMLLMLKH